MLTSWLNTKFHGWECCGKVDITFEQFDIINVIYFSQNRSSKA